MLPSAVWHCIITIGHTCTSQRQRSASACAGREVGEQGMKLRHLDTRSERRNKPQPLHACHTHARSTKPWPRALWAALSPLRPPPRVPRSGQADTAREGRGNARRRQGGRPRPPPPSRGTERESPRCGRQRCTRHRASPGEARPPASRRRGTAGTRRSRWQQSRLADADSVKTARPSPLQSYLHNSRRVHGG